MPRALTIVPRPRRRDTARPEAVFPLAAPGLRLGAVPAQSLQAGLRAAALPDGAGLLVPTSAAAWTEPALRRLGLRACVYGLTAGMAPDEGALEAAFSAGVSAMLLVHPLGFPQDAARWRHWCEERSLLLIEDVTSGWGAESPEGPLGSVGHLALFDFGTGEDGRRAAGLLLAGPLANGDATADEAVEVLGGRAPDAHVAGLRRGHYRMLLERIGDRVPAPFAALPGGAVPFALPLDGAQDAELGPRLRDARVETFRPWPHARPDVLAVPVHHELRREDLERIARAADGHRRPRPEPLRLEEVGAVEDIAEEWGALALEAGTVFGTPDWAGTWWRHFGAGRTPRIHACRTAGGELLAVLPLYAQRCGPLRTLRFLGHGPGDCQGPVCRPLHRPLAGRALRRIVRETGADLLIGEQIPAEDGWSGLLGGHVIAEEGNPVMRWPAGSAWEEVTGRWSSSLRRKSGVSSRRLERAHGSVGHRVSEGGERLAEDFAVLLELHRARWDETPTQFAGTDAAFQRDFAAVADERGWLQLSFLEVAGTPAAAVYDLRFGGVESQYQQGRDPAYANAGFVALVETMRRAHADGLREYRFLRGDEPYKYRFATADPGLETLVYAPPALRSAALSAGVALPRELLAAVGGRLRR
jgi:CelD/BcsL family acetyltransferase involved in cellulose biosynthesis